MQSLRQALTEATKRNVAIGHFNTSDLTALRAIVDAARALKLPVLVGVSEGEREFIGTRTAAANVRSLRDESPFPIFLNADHTHSLERVREVAEAGYDEVIFDARSYRSKRTSSSRSARWRLPNQSVRRSWSRAKSATSAPHPRFWRSVRKNHCT